MTDVSWNFRVKKKSSFKAVRERPRRNRRVQQDDIEHPQEFRKASSASVPGRVQVICDHGMNEELSGHASWSRRGP